MSLRNTQPLFSLPVFRSDKPVDEQNVGDGLDRANLKILRNRFLGIQQQRSARLRDALLPAQRTFLDILPLLFHINHPVLPGYGSTSTPVGIRNFKLKREQIKSARSLSKSFVLQRDLNPRQELSAIFLMGSSGSLAHNSRSDLDIWVCPAIELDEEQHDALQKKCRAISDWARSLNLETHFFIMRDSEFRMQQRSDMNKENCGRTQHYLLLDEFYRTGILLAGCTPLWWFVPDSFETDYRNYADTLLGKRYINELACIDFGTPGEIPAQEYISAGVWQLYKGIESPYKALLKLLLIEAYAADYPHSRNLSATFKSCIYAGDCDIDELDPYMQIYRRVEAYLQSRGEPERLDLIRRCLYFKAGMKLSRAPEQTTAVNSPEQLKQPDPWRCKLMQKLVEEWGWQRSMLVKLDNRESWSLREIKTEQNRLTKELVYSYRLLSTFIKQHTTANNAYNKDFAELNILGRQLHAIFEQKPNKVPRLTEAVADSTAQQLIQLQRQHNSSGRPIWCVELEEEQKDTETTLAPIRQAICPAEILTWCVVNGLVDKHTRFHIERGDHDLTEYEVRQLCSSLGNLLPGRKTTDADSVIKERFARPAQVNRCIFVANCGVDPLQAQKAQDLWRISEKKDPLAYSGIAENLVCTMTLIVTNSWQETFCYHFSGPDALDDCLTHYLSYARPDDCERLPRRHVLCACPTRATSIANRLESLLDNIENWHFSSATTQTAVAHRQYIFESARGLHLLSWQQDLPRIECVDSTDALLGHISQQGQASAITIDELALQNHPLSTICRRLEAGQTEPTGNSQEQPKTGNRIQVYYEVLGDVADIYLIDQQHSICHAKVPFESTRSLVLPLRQFIEQSTLRHATTDNLYTAKPMYSAACGSDSTILQSTLLQQRSDLPDIEFYALRQAGRNYTVNQVPTEANISASYLPIKAVGIRRTSGEISWTIDCNGESFDQLILGDELYHKVARSIKQQRKAQQRNYRCYITDIEVTDPHCRHSSLTHDFYYKNQLEDALNTAFAELGS